jgi:hypothetical protein
MTINYTSMTIEMTKAESKAAGKFGTDAYKDLIAALQQFPNYKILVVTRAATKKSSDYKGLTYDYMEKYIQAHDNEEKSIMAKYMDLRGESEEAKDALADSCSYKEIKKWFLEQFPAIKQFHEKRSEMLGAAN